jgi:hypothetical protein
MKEADSGWRMGRSCASMRPRHSHIHVQHQRRRRAFVLFGVGRRADGELVRPHFRHAAEANCLPETAIHAGPSPSADDADDADGIREYAVLSHLRTSAISADSWLLAGLVRVHGKQEANWPLATGQSREAAFIAPGSRAARSTPRNERARGVGLGPAGDVVAPLTIHESLLSNYIN